MASSQQHNESGFILIAMLAVVVPLALVVGAFTMSMSSRTDRLLGGMDQERALLAAESGLDEGVYRAEIGTLADRVPFSRQISGGMEFTVEPTWLEADGEDNDLDGNTDEADEDVFQLVITGRYRGTQRRIAAYLGPTPLLPNLQAAMTLHSQSPSIRLSGTPLITGNNTNINGTAGNGAASVPGLSIVPPATTATLLGELSPLEQSKVQGPGGPPSLGVANPIPLDEIVAVVANSASLVLTNASYTGLQFGNGDAGTAVIAYRDGDVKIGGNSRGAGILVVTGDLEVKGTFRFDGVIIVLGNILQSAGTATIYGAIVQGPAGGGIDLRGTFSLYFSEQAIALANSIGGRYVSFNGWQEIVR
jgi:hypothetical protein